MKLYLSIFLVGALYLTALSGTNGHKPTCDGNSYSAEIISKKTVSETCVEYEIKVSYDGTRSFGLSHFSIGIPCGEVKNISNSENWKQVFGKDPTTGVYGLKIDNIRGFGENGVDSFTVKFTWCSNGSCDKKLGVVSYKAGLCIDYQTLKEISSNDHHSNDGHGNCNDGSGDHGGEHGGNGGGGSGDGGDGSNGGGDGSGTPSDSTKTTCSTLMAKLKKTNVSCSGGSNGQLEVVIQDGLAPYTYSWSTGATTSSIQNLPEGNYVVTISDANKNIMTLLETISAPPPISITESIMNASCNGFANGAINLNVVGGSGAYTFAWSNGSAQQNIASLGSGSYTVTVTDAGGCTAQKTFTLTNATLISAGVIFTHPTCSQSNGTIDITPNGGVAPYTYLWSTGATTQDLQNGGPGTYSVKITDANGCFVDMVYALRVNNTLILKYSVTPTSCGDDSSGAINLTVTGGTIPYTYLWQDGIASEDRSGLKSGLYKVTVTDASGCSSSININVFKKTFTVNSVITQPLCAGDTGSVTVSPVDGISPYTYSWSNGDKDNSLTSVSSGTYSVTITDASGCSVNMIFVVTSPLAIMATSVVSNAQCGSAGSFMIDLSVSGGKSPYSYSWSNGATSQDLSGLNSGTYSVLITDSNGCHSSQEIVVTPVAVSWTCLINQPTSDIVCHTAGNFLSTSMADASTYQWSVSSTDNSWAITTGSNTASIIYTAGNAGIPATFTLTISKDGCTKTCVYTTSTTGCIEKDNTGGGDPLTGDPCASDTTSTTDPSTSPEPGTPADETSDPADEEVTEPSEEPPTKVHVCAYPNPFRDSDRINFEWTAPSDDYAHVEILDLLGRRTCILFSGNVRKGQSYKCEWAPNGTDQMYIYKYTSSKHVDQGRLVMK